MEVQRCLRYGSCAEFSLLVESPNCGASVRGEVADSRWFEVEGFRFRLKLDREGWHFARAALWDMTHRQRFARLTRALGLDSPLALKERRVFDFVAHHVVAIHAPSADAPAGARPGLLPIHHETAWMPPRLEGDLATAMTTRRGKQLWLDLFQHGGCCVPPSNHDLRSLGRELAAELVLRYRDLSGCNLRESDLSRLSLLGGKLAKAVLIRCNMTGTGLYSADLREADLRHARLTDALMERANLRGANLQGADLRGATLRNADLTGQRLDPLNLAGADLTGATLSGASIAKWGEGDDGIVAVKRLLATLKIEGKRSVLRTIATIGDPALRIEAMRFVVTGLDAAAYLDDPDIDLTNCYPALASELLRNWPHYVHDPLLNRRIKILATRLSAMEKAAWPAAAAPLIEQKTADLMRHLEDEDMLARHAWLAAMLSPGLARAPVASSEECARPPLLEEITAQPVENQPVSRSDHLPPLPPLVRPPASEETLAAIWAAATPCGTTARKELGGTPFDLAVSVEPVVS